MNNSTAHEHKGAKKTYANSSKWMEAAYRIFAAVANAVLVILGGWTFSPNHWSINWDSSVNVSWGCYSSLTCSCNRLCRSFSSSY